MKALKGMLGGDEGDPWFLGVGFFCDTAGVSVAVYCSFSEYSLHSLRMR